MQVMTVILPLYHDLPSLGALSVPKTIHEFLWGGYKFLTEQEAVSDLI